MLDCDEIIPERLWVGAYPRAEDLSEFRSMAISAVISLQDQKDAAGLGISVKKMTGAYTQAGIEFRHVEVRDFDKADLLEKLARCVDALDAALAQGSARVYLHCTAGLNRAPTAAAAFLIRSQGMSARQAYDYVVARRYCRPHLDVLDRYAASLKTECSPGA